MRRGALAIAALLALAVLSGEAATQPGPEADYIRILYAVTVGPEVEVPPDKDGASTLRELRMALEAAYEQAMCEELSFVRTDASGQALMAEAQRQKYAFVMQVTISRFDGS